MRRRTPIPLLALAGASALAHAAPDRPTLPGTTLAGDDGAAALWRNPANFALAPDGGLYAAYGRGFTAGAPSGLALALQEGALGMGLSYRSDPGAPGIDSWTTFSTGLGLRLDERLAMGTHLGWQLPSGPDNNFVTWDLAMTWRPLPWLGLGGVIQDIGEPHPELGVEQRLGPGIAIRPWGDRLMLGADYLVTGPEGSAPDGLLEVALDARPAEGVVLRGTADSTGRVGLGLEVWFGEYGSGVMARSDTDGGSASGLAWIVGSDTAERVAVGPGRIVDLTLDEAYPYQPSGGLFSEPGEGYVHLLQRLEGATRDRSVRGIVLRLETVPFSFAQVEELRAILGRAREAGKPVVVYLDESTSNAAYFLASAADEVVMHPAATLDVTGLSAELQFYRGLLDLVGLDAQYTRRSEYKSGPEPWTRTEASEPYREQINALLDDLSGRWAGGIAEARNLSVEAFLALVDRAPLTAREALDAGLVDTLAYPDELEDALADRFGDDVQVDEDYRLPDPTPGWPAPHAIALIYVDGPITTGWSSGPGLLSGRVTGSRTVVAQLDAAREDDRVKAVLLRVDSPGGSSFASDQIWRAVRRVVDEGKPVIVSMGSVAASGGYYVSAGATAIYAEPTTITGSIGVYAGKLNFAGLYDRLGVTTEVYTRGRNADMWSASHPLDEQAMARMDALVDDTYRQFKRRVAEGRGLTEEQVEAVARGRVWSGARAREVGLVDELGGFVAAVERAREEADLAAGTPVDLVVYGDRPGADGELSRRTVEAGTRRLPTREALARGVLAPELLAPDAPPPLPAEVELARRAARSGERVWALWPVGVRIR